MKIINFHPTCVSATEFDAFVRLPENRDQSFELIGGVVCPVVSNPLSSKLGAKMVTFLGIYMLNHDIGHVTGADGGYWVSGERYIPDAAFIRYEKQPILAYEDGYVPVAPDLAVEVLSPSNDDEKMRIKITNYLAAGTVVWALEPLDEVIEVYIPGQPVQILRHGDTLEGGSVLPGFSLKVSEIFVVSTTP